MQKLETNSRVHAQGSRLGSGRPAPQTMRPAYPMDGHRHLQQAPPHHLPPSFGIKNRNNSSGMGDWEAILPDFHDDNRPKSHTHISTKSKFRFAHPQNEMTGVWASDHCKVPSGHLPTSHAYLFFAEKTLPRNTRFLPKNYPRR